METGMAFIWMWQGQNFVVSETEVPEKGSRMKLVIKPEKNAFLIGIRNSRSVIHGKEMQHIVMSLRWKCLCNDAKIEGITGEDYE